MTSEHDPNRYYRLASIPYHWFEQWLNLPNGFAIDAIEHDLLRGGLTLRIKCPPDSDYYVPDFAFGLFIAPEEHIKESDGYCWVDRLSWPDLEQSQENTP